MCVIVKIDGYYQEVLLSGRKCSKQKLREYYFTIKKHAMEITDIPVLFRLLYGFEVIPFDKEIEIDFVIDTDTDYVY